ncbi:hypothetical protein [Pareuzebyella sediminis]|uniref:hypothetical protein n=1 Tax=Pareuzebyella sediminis TaxID=2607998 RepID=UPI0011ED35FF|nr:hypothetical protein [Pareuzebyella sediminis]
MSFKVNLNGLPDSKSIKTKYVYSENSQVFLKKETEGDTLTEEQWFPINFQWIPVVELHKSLTEV